MRRSAEQPVTSEHHPLAERLYQIAYVSTDLEAGMRQLGAIHGISASGSNTMSRFAGDT